MICYYEDSNKWLPLAKKSKNSLVLFTKKKYNVNMKCKVALRILCAANVKKREREI